MRPYRRALSSLVLARVEGVLSKGFASDYASLAVDVGYLIRASGLLATLHYLAEVAARKPDANRSLAAKQLLEDFVVGLRNQDTPSLAWYIPEKDVSVSAWAETIAGLSTGEYMQVSTIALEQAEWFKRFAESALGAVRGAAQP